MKPRGWIVAAVAALQVGVLAYMAGEREWVVRTGERVLVRTAPIDPNDPMRGYYARLDYEISAVPRALCRDGVAAWFDENTVYSREKRDRRVYAVLERDSGVGVASLVALTDREPAEGLFLRGRVDWITSHEIRVRYGIEALFMEQGRALEFENTARYEKVGVPVNAEVAIGAGGLGVLCDTHWEPLGIAVRLVRRERPEGEADSTEARARAGVISAVVTLKNHSESPVAIVDRPGGGSFRLIVADRAGPAMYVPVPRDEVATAPDARDIVLLGAGESREVTLDLTQPEWFVVKPAQPGTDAATAPPVALETLAMEWGSWFRIEYVPPSQEACAGLPDAAAIRHARLRSRMFTPSGGGD